MVLKHVKVLNVSAELYFVSLFPLMAVMFLRPANKSLNNV